MKVRIGTWTDIDRLRKTLDSVTLSYAIVIFMLGVIFSFGGNNVMGVLLMVMSLPLWLIQYSKYRFDKLNKLMKDETKQNSRKADKSKEN